MLSSDYDQLVKEGLNEFSGNMKALAQKDEPEIQYTLFYPTIGKDYYSSKVLMVYGQAVKGWNNEWTINQIPAETEEIFKKGFEHSQGDEGKCPLEWINEDWVKHKLFRSFFWNVTYKLIKAKYQRTDQNWNNIMAWSNLIKIAPAAHANPNLREIDAQLEYSAKLFFKELDELQPKNALLITNLETWAAPILNRGGINITYISQEDSPFVQAIANYGLTRIIVTKRPYFSAHLPFIEEVMRYMVST